MRTKEHRTPNEIIDEIIAAYDAIVRANDAVEAVAYCEDGIYGAFGEVCEVANDLGYGLCQGVSSDDIAPAFAAYQAGLREEVER